MNINPDNIIAPVPTNLGNISDGREIASSYACQRFLMFLIFKEIINVEDEDSVFEISDIDAKEKIKRLVEGYADKESLGNLFCNEFFVESFAIWLTDHSTKFTSDGGHLASGTILGHLSVIKAINFTYFKQKAQVFYDCENATMSNANLLWYSTLRRKIEVRCGLRDIKLLGKVNEGEKKYSIGRELARKMAEVDLSIGTSDSLVDLVKRGIVFLNAGKGRATNFFVIISNDLI